MGEAAFSAARSERITLHPVAAVEITLSGGNGDDTSAVPVAPEGCEARERRSTLTRREEEVAVLVARGLTNRRLAEELSISEYTVANHVTRILRKLGLESRTQLGAWVASGGAQT